MSTATIERSNSGAKLPIPDELADIAKTGTGNLFSTESIAADQLRSIVERIERVDEEIAGLKGDRKDILVEARSTGFDTKIINKIVALRKKDYAERQEEEAILDLYKAALGMA